MKCPECHSSLLRVGVAFTGSIACQFSRERSFRVLEKVALDTEFDDDSDCRCLACNWQGLVRDLPTATDQAQKPRPKRPVSFGPLMNAAELYRLEQQLPSFEPEARRAAERLIEEVRRLQSLLDAVTRASESPESTDTWVG